MAILLNILCIIAFVSMLLLMIVFREKIFARPTKQNFRSIKILTGFMLIFFAIDIFFFIYNTLPFYKELGMEPDWLIEIFGLIDFPAVMLCLYFLYKNALKKAGQEEHPAENENTMDS